MVLKGMTGKKVVYLVVYVNLEYDPELGRQNYIREGIHELIVIRNGMKWENGFMKNNISGNKYLLSLDIIKFVSLYANGISKKNANSSPGIKFSTMNR